MVGRTPGPRGTPRARRRDGSRTDGHIPRAGGRTGGRASLHRAGDGGQGRARRPVLGGAGPGTNLHEGIRQVTGTVHHWQMATGHNFHLQLPRHHGGFGLSEDSCRNKQASLRRASERAPGGGEPRGRAEGRRGRAPTDSGRRRAPHSRSEEEPRRPARTPRPHSGEAAGGRAPASGAALALTRRREPPSPVGSPQSGHRAHPPFSSHLPKMAARGAGAIDHSVLGHSAGPI